jgi:hypothetical protein
VFQAADGDPFGLATGLMVPASAAIPCKRVTLAAAVSFLMASLPVAVGCIHLTTSRIPPKDCPLCSITNVATVVIGTLKLKRIKCI